MNENVCSMLDQRHKKLVDILKEWIICNPCLAQNAIFYCINVVTVHIIEILRFGQTADHKLFEIKQKQ